MAKQRLKKKLIVTPLLFLCLFSLWPFQLIYNKHSSTPISVQENKVLAHPIYAPVAGNLVVGTTGGVDATNTGSWKGTLASDNFYWNIVRTAASTSLDANLEFAGVDLLGGNKLIITTEDTNITTATAYYHQICDWISTTNVDDAADAQCTGGGWRTLNPRKITYTNTAETSRDYEIYDGYFWNTAAAPGTVLSTPLSNFVKTTTNTVKIRILSKISSTVAVNIDRVQLETAIDPYYEPAAFNKTTGGTITGNITDLIGPASSTNVTASDGNKLTVPMSAINTAVDIDFTFENVKTYTGTNTILITPEICVSNVALTFGIYLYNYTTAGYTQIGTNTTGTACTTDTDYAYSFNSTSIGGFSIADYVSSGNVKLRILTNAPATVYNIQIDRIYMLVGSVNTDTAKCEISWGTGTATNCSNTRSINQARTGTPTGSTWQATAALEYPSSFYSQDNDDDATAAEYAASQNLSFPVTLSSNMSVTAIHYAAKYRSNSTAQTLDLQIRDYSGNNGVSGWINTPGTDTNLATTYSWFDTWGLVEYQTAPKDSVDTVNNLMNLRARTSAGTTTNPGTRDWAFAVMSIRWVEETNRRTFLTKFPATGGLLVTGSEVATDAANTGSWKGVLGNDSATNGSGNYWTTARSNGGTPGLNKQIEFDGVQIYSSNKMIVSIEDTNITTATAYIHQICDWTSTTGVDNAADAQCTGGGWRTLNETKTNYTVIADTLKNYEIYDGYFSDRTSSPGTVYATPLTNFIEATAKTVLIRAYSTVSSTVQHRMDLAQIEMAIDPVYDAASITAIAPHTISATGFISDTRGTTSSDGSKLVLTNNATNPINAYFSFKNVDPYTGANTILVRPEICVSTTALTFTTYLYNFTTTAWDALTGAAVTGTACTTDTTYSYTKNNITMTDYVNAGEVRVRIGTAVANTNTLQIDRLYIMIGSTNVTAAASDCEISFGGGTLANCANTRTVADAEGGSTATSTWQISNQFEWPTDYYGFDEPSASTGTRTAFAANLSFPVTVTSGMSITGVHFATRWRSNSTAMTIAATLRDYGGKSNATGGWTQVGTTNALTTYGWSDSRVSTPIITYPEAYVDTVSNKMNMRMRTNTTTSTAQNVTMDWDFAMMSIRWNEPMSGTLSADIVDAGGSSVASPSISFNNITTSFTCQAATATFGTSSEKIRISNTSGNPAWSLSIAATGGVTANWQDVATDQYDFNDSGGSGCTDSGDADALPGQMSLSFGSAVITASGGCSNTGLSFGSSTGFVQGTTDSAVLVTASASAQTGCYWDITGISVSQQIPSDQPSGTYNLNMSLSVVSN